jgi:hypothetical protein
MPCVYTVYVRICSKHLHVVVHNDDSKENKNSLTRGRIVKSLTPYSIGDTLTPVIIIVFFYVTYTLLSVKFSQKISSYDMMEWK